MNMLISETKMTAQDMVTDIMIETEETVGEVTDHAKEGKADYIMIISIFLKIFLIQMLLK